MIIDIQLTCPKGLEPQYRANWKLRAELLGAVTNLTKADDRHPREVVMAEIESSGQQENHP